MSTESAYMFLEQLQAAVYGSLGTSPSISPTLRDLEIWASYFRLENGTSSADQDLSEIEHHMSAALTEATESLPTKYEDPQTHFLINELAKHLKTAAEVMGAK